MVGSRPWSGTVRLGRQTHKQRRLLWYVSFFILHIDSICCTTSFDLMMLWTCSCCVLTGFFRQFHCLLWLIIWCYSDCEFTCQHFQLPHRKQSCANLNSWCTFVNYFLFAPLSSMKLFYICWIYLYCLVSYACFRKRAKSFWVATYYQITSYANRSHIRYVDKQMINAFNGY